MRFRKNVVVIGGNAAGAAAAAKAKRTAPETDVWLLERGEYISTGTCEIPHVISGEISSPEKLIFYTPESFFTEKKVNVKILHEVNSIDRKKKRLEVTDIAEGRTFYIEYDKLILATGSKLRPLADDLNAPNLFDIKSVNELKGILDYFEKFNPKDAVIFGAGYVGIEIAEALALRGIHVKLLEKHGSVLSSAEPEIQSCITRLIQEKGIEFYPSINKVSFRVADGNIRSVVAESRVIDADIYFNCTGFIPESTLAQNAGIKTGINNSICVNSYLQSTDPDIFAAGDCIEVTELISNKKATIQLATLAHEQGHTAGYNSVSINKKHSKKVIKSFSVRLFSHYLTQCGLTAAESIKTGLASAVISGSLPNLVKAMPGSGETFGKIVFERGSKQIFGASFFGDKEVSGYSDLIAFMIRKRIPLTELADVDFNYTPSLSPFRNLLSVLSRKVR